MEFLNIYRLNCSGQPEQEAARVLKEGVDENGSVEISFDIPDARWPGVWRTVSIQTDGTVSVRDVPQASGMSESQCTFVGPGGGGEGVVPPPRWRSGRWTRPHLLKKKRK